MRCRTGQRLRGEELLTHGAEDVAEHAGEDVVGHACSFTFKTPVSTAKGEQAIGSLKVGQKVWAYNPTTKKMELESIKHVWINHDDDLIDLAISYTAKDKQGHPVQQVDTIHTNKKHPFLTQEQGFTPVAQLIPGMHIVRADGSLGTVVAWEVVPGTSTMYNLEVDQDHTYTVSDGQWVVHNSCGGGSTEDVFLPKNKYPEASSTIQEARDAGHPTVQHVERDLADGNRNASLAGHPTRPGLDRDEYPMAMTQEGGAGAYIKYINPSDNRGAGSFISKQLSGVPNGTPFVIHIIDEWLF